jgi:putative DNA methylase
MTSTIPTPPPEQRRKLIEVSIPLEKINEQSSREKSLRSGHPSTLHQWWSRKPTATARAVVFAQIVDDPASRPDLFPTVKEQDAEREELFRIIEHISNWDTVKSDPEGWFDKARAKIMLYTDGNPPAVADPFAGGGSIPLEAQRLGLEAHASDVNPVAVLLEKALIEIPPKFADQPPVHPGAAELLKGQDADTWPGATGLAEDVRWYGEWILEEAKKRIGHLYPEADLDDGTTAPVIAWLWVRTVTCPNPACGIAAPLTSSWWVSKKKGHEAYVVPTVTDGEVSYEVHHGAEGGPEKREDGTIKGRTGATCIACGSSISIPYIRSEGVALKLGEDMMAVVAAGNRQRIYLSPTTEQEAAAQVTRPNNLPSGSIAENPRWFSPPQYGISKYSELFTSRQATTLTTLCDLLTDLREKICQGSASNINGTYASAVTTYIAIAISKLANTCAMTTTWMTDRGAFRETFSRQALPMSWDFAESNPLGKQGASFLENVLKAAASITTLPLGIGTADKLSALAAPLTDSIISTDPPYYDYIGYSDLSDFYYIWLRHALREIYPSLFNQTLSPKSTELVADPYRHGSKKKAKEYFEDGFVSFFNRARQQASQNYPTSVYYAFKQQDSKTKEGSSSTGWETVLEGIIRTGWQITATWPMRTESSGRILARGTNAIASTIALVLRPRPENAPTTTRRDFLRELKTSLPQALRDLQRGTVAPVDLPQSAIGPGIGLFSKYSGVLEADGHKMNVRSALRVINEILDEVLSEQEGEYDADTRFALAWFRSYGFGTEAYGSADSLARARNTSVEHLQRAGILHSGQGKVTLHSPEKLHQSDEETGTPYDPAADSNVSAWETVLHLAKELEYGDGVASAGRLLARVPDAIDRDLCKQLAFLLFQISEQRNEAKTALLFNQLGTAWNDIAQTARDIPEHERVGTPATDDMLF